MNRSDKLNILVTGANRGLGLELVKLFLREGHVVAAGARNNSNIDNLSLLMQQYNQNFKVITLDISDETSIAKSAEVMKNEWGTLDVIINNAGILLGREKKFDELTMDHLMASFQINTFGPMMVIKHFYKLLKKSGNAAIINITSESANDFGSNDFAYSMSKAALNMYSYKINSKLKDEGVKVLAIHPGWIRTDMGGQNAPNSPKTTAQNILKIIEGKLDIDNESVFIDHMGKRL